MDEKRLRYIDIGANLLDPMFQGQYNGKAYHDADLPAVLQRAWDAGVDKIIITAGTLAEAEAALELAQTDPRLFCTVGVHPTRCGEFDASEAGPDGYLRQLSQVISRGVALGKVVAVGECGLDYDRLQFCDKATQQKYFRRQFELAQDAQLPMFLHMRAASADFTSILSQHVSSFTGGVVHSFDGSLEAASDLLALHPRLYIGINGCSLKTEENCDTMAAIPLDRLMIETDAPWCDLRPTHASSEHVKTRRGAKDRKKHDAHHLVKGRNEPCNVDQVLQVIAGRKGLNNTWAVAETIFRITEQLFFPKQAAPVAKQ